MAIINLPRIARIDGGAHAELPAAMAQLGLSRPLVVTDPFLAGSGMVDTLLGVLATAALEVREFTDTVSDPTAASV